MYRPYLSQTYIHANLAIALISGSISTNTALIHVPTDDVADITVFHLFPDLLLSIVRMVVVMSFTCLFSLVCPEISN